MRFRFMQYLRLIVSIFLIIFFCFCASGEEVDTQNKNEDKTYWDELSTYISGLPLEENNRFYPLGELDFYKAYMRMMDKSWKKIDTNYIRYVSKWSKENSPEANKLNTAIYPLSGADFINLYHIYPDAPSYIMIGLETPGYVNDPILYKPKELKNAFFLLNASLNQIASQNYFTTILMEKKFSNKYFPGVAPMLLVFLKRLGFSIDGLQRISLTKDGMIKELDQENINDSPESYQGIRIIFHSEDDAKKRELIFLKIYVNQDSANSSSIEGKFLLRQKRLNLVMKSSIYLMHMEKYRNFINAILARTDMVVEDDSGIPIRYFSREEWDIQVFGKYKRRISIRYVKKEADMFKTEKGNIKTESQKFTQDDLKKIYDSSARPLLFKYGYGGASNSSAMNNLLLLRRHSLLKKSDE